MSEVDACSQPESVQFSFLSLDPSAFTFCGSDVFVQFMAEVFSCDTRAEKKKQKVLSLDIQLLAQTTFNC